MDGRRTHRRTDAQKKIMFLSHTLNMRGSDVTSLVEFRPVVQEETDRQKCPYFKTHVYTFVPVDGRMEALIISPSLLF